MGLHVSDFGFRIVTTAIPRRTLKSYPMYCVQSWRSSEKIFTFWFTDDSASTSGGVNRSVQTCQLSTTWVPAIMETVDKVVARVISTRESRRMSDEEFLTFVGELDAVPAEDKRRVSMILQYTQKWWVTASQGREAVRRIPEENGFDRIRLVAGVHARMIDPANFALVIDELRPQDRDSAWDLISKGTAYRK